MTDLYTLPRSMTLGGREYPIHADFRQILRIIYVLEDPQWPEFLRWQVALELFCPGVPDGYRAQALEFLGSFIRCGAPDVPGPRLLDWQKDAAVIISDVNKAAGRELRQEKFVHWWTFLGWFHAIGQGQLATLVSIRDKRRRGQKLEGWEQEFYSQNKQQVDLPPRLTAAEEAERARLNMLLNQHTES